MAIMKQMLLKKEDFGSNVAERLMVANVEMSPIDYLSFLRAQPGVGSCDTTFICEKTIRNATSTFHAWPNE